MITFGRFSDSFKATSKVEAWNTSERLFLEKKYTDSYEAFFNYLRDDDTNNVNFKKEGDKIDFELLQGSKMIHGYIANGKVICEVDIASYEKLSVAFMRRLMEMNYSLFYCRYALKDNKICIKFDSTIPAASPRKLYYAWKELATRADKQDDILTDDFSMLHSVGNSHVEQLSETEKEVKYNFFKGWLDNTLKRIAELNEDALSGGISYLLLNTIYKIDYLVAPEGTLMNDIEKMNRDYFAKDNKSYVERNRKIKESLQKLSELPKEKIIEDLYRVKSTFGIATPAPHKAVIDLFNINLQNIKWYLDNAYIDIAVVMYEYLATYCFFSYGLPKPDAKLFHLILNITNQDFFTALGEGEVLYDSAGGKLHEQVIIAKIDAIIKESNEQYPELKFNTENLKFDSLVIFLKTYFAEIQQLNFNQ